MSILKVLEILSESKVSWEDATARGIEKAAESVRNIRSAYIHEQSVTVVDGKVNMYRVNLKITFAIE